MSDDRRQKKDKSSKIKAGMIKTEDGGREETDDRCQRTEGQEKDEHRTPAVPAPVAAGRTSNVE